MAVFSRTDRPRVCVVGVGACTPVGFNAESAAAAVRARITGFHEHPYMVDSAGEKMVVARVDALSPGLPIPDRLATLTAAAASEALAPLRQQRYGGETRVPAVIGLPAVRLPASGDLLAGFQERMQEVRMRLGFGDTGTLSTGHSAGLMALQAGVAKIQDGEKDLCLIGGVDSYLDADTLEWLNETEQLHSEANIWGFIPGEAAGFCLLASDRAAARFGLNPLLWIGAVTSADEPNLIRTDTVCTGQGLSQAVKHVLGVLPAGDRVHQTICDLNGERYRSDELAFTITRTSRRFVDASDVLAPATCWGDVGAASGPLFLSLAAAAASGGYADGPNTLLWTSSDTGERGAALVCSPAMAG